MKSILKFLLGIYQIKLLTYYNTSGSVIKSKCLTMDSRSPVWYGLWLPLSHSWPFFLSLSSLVFMFFLKHFTSVPTSETYLPSFCLKVSFSPVYAQAAHHHSGLCSNVIFVETSSELLCLNRFCPTSHWYLYPINHSTPYLALSSIFSS